MNFYSTRNKSIIVNDTTAILDGLSKDGGLYLPEFFPTIDLNLLIDMNYLELCEYILGLYFESFSKEEIKCIVESSYLSKFSSDNLISMKNFENITILELFNGPTSAFKDFALQILPNLIQYSKKKTNNNSKTIILTATSGDTGIAAIEGFKNIDGIDIFVFYPTDGVSEIQKMQMIKACGENVYVAGINGNFDDAQSAVKQIFNDKEYIKNFNDNNIFFSSANSINIGRLIPQIVYYIFSYLQLVKTNKIYMDDKINICVPTGNFGNILASYYAYKMGLPVNNFICATNENNVLKDFFTNGKYNSKRTFFKTTSPSMDILISSNLERLICEFLGPDNTKQFMNDLLIKNEFEVSSAYFKSFEKFISYDSNSDEVSNSIYEFSKIHKYIMDPHTAVAYNAYEKYSSNSLDLHHTILVSTASPFKFSDTVLEAIKLVQGNNIFDNLKLLSNASKINIPTKLAELESSLTIHADTICKSDIKAYIQEKMEVNFDEN